jgi:predicted dehydrogenase
MSTRIGADASPTNSACAAGTRTTGGCWTTTSSTWVPGPRLVTVCTMPATHREIALAALAAGAHVLCEKPFAPSLDEAQEMVEAARAAGRLLTVGFNMRYTANARALHDVVRKGHIGAPIYGRAWGRAGDLALWTGSG